MNFISFNMSSAIGNSKKEKPNGDNYSNLHLSLSEKIRNEMQRLQSRLNDDVVKPNVQLYASEPIVKATQNIDKKYQRVDVKFNKKIENSMQNTDEANCWLLTGINTFRGTKQGQKVINNSIEIVDCNNPDSDVIVHLKGLNKSYLISQKDIENNQSKLSSGDADVKAIELAVRMYREEIIASGKGQTELDENYQNFCGSCEANAPNDLGTPDELIFYLTGIKPEATNLENSTCKNVMTPEQILAKIQKNPENYATWVGFKDMQKNINGKSVEYAHACAIAKVTNDAVHIVDSWDSSKIVVKNKAEFLKSIYEITTTNLSSVQ